MILTFEKIRELYWKERESQKLQEMPENFLRDSSEYLSGSDDGIKSALNDLIDSRNTKILKMAFVAAKSGSPQRPQNLMREEECLFYRIIESLKEFRSNISDGKHAEVCMKQEILQVPKPVPEENPKEGFCLIKENMPSFIGNDMKTYHLRKGDKVYLPAELMSLLTKKGVCERLN